MTREELEMRVLVRESDVIDRTDGSELAKAFNHLWEKYVEQESCDDTISRQALLDAFGFSEKTRKWGGDHSGYDTMMLYEIQDVIESQPPVKPQEPKIVPIAEIKFDEDELKELVDKAVLTVTPQEPIDYKAQYESFAKKAEIVISQLRADRDRLADFLDKIRADIKQLPTAKCTETHRIYIDVADFKEDVLAIIDKYRSESEGKE